MYRHAEQKSGHIVDIATTKPDQELNIINHFALASKLSNIHDGLFQTVSNLTAKMKACVTSLGVSANTSKALRSALRLEWSNLKYQGIGVTHF